MYANSIEYGKACNAQRTVEDAQMLEMGIFKVQATGIITLDALYHYIKVSRISGLLLSCNNVNSWYKAQNYDKDGLKSWGLWRWAKYFAISNWLAPWLSSKLIFGIMIHR